MKRLSVFALALALMLALSGCASQPQPAPIVTAAPTPTPEPAPMPQNGTTIIAAPQSGGMISVENGIVTPEPVIEAPQEGYGTNPQSLFSIPSQDLTIGADLVMGVVAAAGSGLNPLTCNARDLDGLSRLVFESVVELDDNLRPVALLADNWTIDGKTITFTLRQGVRFHDGTNLTAYDVSASFSAIQTFGDFSPYFSRIRYIRELNVIDDYTVEVVGQYGGYMTLYAMTFPVISQLSLSSVMPRGTGPYWYVSTNDNGDFRMERNPLWWKKQANIHSIAAVRFDSDAEVLTAFESNLIDCVATRSTAAALSRQLSDRSTLEYSTMTWECLIPNLSESILGELPVRQAIMYAMDRSTLANTVYLGIVQESEVPIIPGSAYYETQSTQYNYNPERALQILYDAGWQDTNGDGVLDRIKDGLWEDLAFEITTYDEPGYSLRTEAIALLAQQLNRIGFHVTTSTISKTRAESNLARHSFDLMLVAFNLSEVPDLSYLFAVKGKGNFAGYSSERMTELLNSVQTASDEEVFSAKLSDVRMLVVQDLPILGLFFRTGVLMSHTSLGGLSGLRESQTLRGIQYVNW